MSVLGWIVLAGLAIRALALIGSAVLLLPEWLFSRVVMPLVALAAGALLPPSDQPAPPHRLAVPGRDGMLTADSQEYTPTGICCC
jgi:hypothetical protein